MPIWLIEYFGASELDSAFILIALMTAPVWIAMIFFPRLIFLKGIAHPFIIPPFYAVVLIVLLWKSYHASVLPEAITQASYSGAREFAEHPVAFLALFCNLQILNLAAGTMIYQKAMRSGFRAPVELTLCWLFGALALIPFSLRLILRGRPLAK